MLKETYPYYLANCAVSPNADLVVTDKYTGEVATRVAMADETAIDAAIGAAARAAEPMRRMPAHARQAVLNHCVRRFEERSEELAMALCIEAGKPIKDARGEVTRPDRHLPVRGGGGCARERGGPRDGHLGPRRCLPGNVEACPPRTRQLHRTLQLSAGSLPTRSLRPSPSGAHLSSSRPA